MSRGEALSQAITDESCSALDAYVREGARQLLQRACECEVKAFLADHADRIDQRGRKQVVRNSYQPVRTIMTVAGPPGRLLPLGRTNTTPSDHTARWVI